MCTKIVFWLHSKTIICKSQFKGKNCFVVVSWFEQVYHLLPPGKGRDEALRPNKPVQERLIAVLLHAQVKYDTKI